MPDHPRSAPRRLPAALLPLALLAAWPAAASLAPGGASRSAPVRVDGADAADPRRADATGALPPEARELLERSRLDQELVLAEPTAVMLGELLRAAAEHPAAAPAGGRE